MTAEAADELQLVPGVLAVAAVKATNVVIELPSPSPSRANPSQVEEASWSGPASALAPCSRWRRCCSPLCGDDSDDDSGGLGRGLAGRDQGVRGGIADGRLHRDR